MALYLKNFILPRLTTEIVYPYNIFAPKKLHNIAFTPITIFYGSNGSGKSTLLNIIARKLNIEMLDKGNDAETLQPFIDKCDYEVTAPFGKHCDIPEYSRFIRSEEILHGIVRTRQRNECVKQHIRKANSDLYEQFFNNSESKKAYVWSSDFWIYNALEKFKELRSNGEQAFDYFQDNIFENTLILLDEPETSLSPKYQKELAKMITDYTRFFKCQFVIATHSPFILAIDDTTIYNLDIIPTRVCYWTELENVKLYADLFKHDN